MRSRFLSQALIFVIGVFLLACATQAKMTKVDSAKVSEKISTKNTFVKPQLESRIQQLEEDSKGNSIDYSWKSLSRLEADIKALRSDSGRQLEQDEIYVETVMMVIKEIPRRKEFKKENCDQYRRRILSEYDPQHETKPSAAVSKGLQVLDIFCR